jgi:hypothetical protein
MAILVIMHMYMEGTGMVSKTSWDVIKQIFAHLN